MTVALFARVLDNLGEEHKFNFNVISGALQEIVQSALEGILNVVIILILDVVAARLR
jgi:hypothetical protein